jgi:hypothetical protein
MHLVQTACVEGILILYCATYSCASSRQRETTFVDQRKFFVDVIPRLFLLAAASIRGAATGPGERPCGLWTWEGSGFAGVKCSSGWILSAHRACGRHAMVCPEVAWTGETTFCVQALRGSDMVVGRAGVGLSVLTSLSPKLS